MRRLLALALIGTSGCGMTWITTQATGTQGAWDEHVREEAVPLPGVTEQLKVELPLAVAYEQVETPGVNGAAATHHDGAAIPFALACSVTQSGKNRVFHSAFRYGSQWKKETGIAFLLEGGLAALLIGTASAAHPNGYIYGTFFALDALVAGSIFFIPRKEIFRQDDVLVSTPIRTDCPENLALDIGGERYPIDAVGKIGEVGEQALNEWMAAPKGPLLANFDGKSMELEIGANEQCTWLRAHDRAATCQPALAPRATSAEFTLAAGTLAVP